MYLALGLFIGSALSTISALVAGAEEGLDPVGVGQALHAVHARALPRACAGGDGLVRVLAGLAGRGHRLRMNRLPDHASSPLSRPSYSFWIGRPVPVMPPRMWMSGVPRKMVSRREPCVGRIGTRRA